MIIKLLNLFMIIKKMRWLIWCKDWCKSYYELLSYEWDI